MDDPHPVRVRIVVAYDGTPFSGFAANAGVRTVAGELIAALGRILGAETAVSVAGRTDKGVHAAGQVCTFDLPVGVDESVVRSGRLQRGLNSLVGPAIAILDIAEVPSGFDARFSAIWRRYRYTVWNRLAPNPRLANWSWHVAEPLDLAALNQAATPLIGEHDFSSFCRRPPAGPNGAHSLVRQVLDAGWTAHADGRVELDIVATAFCHQMVRSVTALMVEVGRGRRRAVEVSTVLRARERARSAGVAPPHGLSLVEVGYEDGWTSGRHAVGQF